MIQPRAGYFFLRALPRPLAAMAKSSIFLPDLSAAVSQRGLQSAAGPGFAGIFGIAVFGSDLAEPLAANGARSTDRDSG
jgi:hypothetical protein